MSVIPMGVRNSAGWSQHCAGDDSLNGGQYCVRFDHHQLEADLPVAA